MSKGKFRASTWLAVGAVLLTLGAAGAGYAFAWRTFVAWGEPVIIALCLGSALGSVLSRRIGKCLEIRSRWLAVTASVVMMSAVCYGALMTLNYTLADKSTATPIEATVIGRHTEERTKYRRSGRNRVRADGHYKVYYVTVKFDNGATRASRQCRSLHTHRHRLETPLHSLRRLPRLPHLPSYSFSGSSTTLIATG